MIDEFSSASQILMRGNITSVLNFLNQEDNIQFSGFVMFFHQTRDVSKDYMSLVMRKPAFCICENKDADQLRGNREADQRLCFRYTDSTIPLLHKSEISSLSPSSLTVQPGLCRTWSETPKTGFLRTRLICSHRHRVGFLPSRLF